MNFSLNLLPFIFIIFHVFVVVSEFRALNLIKDKNSFSFIFLIPNRVQFSAEGKQ